MCYGIKDKVYQDSYKISNGDFELFVKKVSVLFDRKYESEDVIKSSNTELLEIKVSTSTAKINEKEEYKKEVTYVI